MRHTFTAATLILAAICGAVAAQTQPTGQGSDPEPPAALFDDIRTLLNSNTDRDQVQSQLALCVPPADPVQQVVVTIDVRLGADGNPAAPASLAFPLPDQARPDHFRQMLRLEGALRECTPFRIDNTPLSNATLSLTAANDQIIVADVIRDDARSAGERALTLSRADRAEIQRRLALAGQDPGTPDGVFGPRTRTAVSSWQSSRGLPASGYLDQAQIDQLRSETETAYQSDRARPTRRATGRSRTYRDGDGCLRYRSTRRIVPGRSLQCDMIGLLQL